MDDNIISRMSESVSWYAKKLVDHSLIVQKIVERVQKNYVVDANGKEHFCNKKNFERVKELVEFNLKEISIPEIQKIRNSSNTPIFLYKENYKLYYTELPNRLHFEDIIVGEHKCATLNDDCKRLSAKPDLQGGCQKVRDRILKLEKYLFIKKGYQVFNTSNNCFVVLECDNFEIFPARKANNENMAEALNSVEKLLKNFKDFHLDDNDNSDDDIFPRNIR